VKVSTKAYTSHSLCAESQPIPIDQVFLSSLLRHHFNILWAQTELRDDQKYRDSHAE